MKKKIILVCFSMLVLAGLILTWPWLTIWAGQSNKPSITPKLEKMVSVILQAYSFHFTQKATNSIRETQSALSDAVEVTQLAQGTLIPTQKTSDEFTDEHYI